MDAKKIEELNRWKKYDIKVTFQEIKPKRGKSFYQMLVFFNDDLVYATKKGTFSVVTKREQKLKSIKKYWFDWKNFDDWNTIEYEVLQWDAKARQRFINWCKHFRICVKIQEEVTRAKIDFQKQVLSPEKMV